VRLVEVSRAQRLRTGQTISNCGGDGRWELHVAFPYQSRVEMQGARKIAMLLPPRNNITAKFSRPLSAHVTSPVLSSDQIEQK